MHIQIHNTLLYKFPWLKTFVFIPIWCNIGKKYEIIPLFPRVPTVPKRLKHVGYFAANSTSTMTPVQAQSIVMKHDGNMTVSARPEDIGATNATSVLPSAASNVTVTSSGADQATRHVVRRAVESNKKGKSSIKHGITTVHNELQIFWV